MKVKIVSQGIFNVIYLGFDLKLNKYTACCLNKKFLCEEKLLFYFK